MKKIVMVLAAFASVAKLFSQVILPPVIGEGMVLQQNAQAPIWGKSTPGREVVVKTGWDNREYRTRTGADSLWKVSVDTPAASYTKHTFRIIAGDVVTVGNVLIGEVWLCGGQSNMEMPMRGFTDQPVSNSAEDIANSANDYIRCITIQRQGGMTRRFATPGSWVSMSPETTPKVSATAYYFARVMQKELDVPVGLLSCSYGGSRIEAWIPEQDLRAAFPEIQIPQNDAGITSAAATPVNLYNSMMNTLAGYAIRGTLWYQGEANRKNYDEYAELFRVMHAAWQREWQQQFPIYLCQIAPFDYAPRGEVSNLGFIREAQASIPETQPNTAIAILLDVGEQNIIHPARKREVGERLAAIALHKNYGREVEWQSPVYAGATFNGKKAIISFKAAGRGLQAAGELAGFELAGSDKVFHPATARIVGDRVEVVSSDVKKPVAVRYCFKSFVVGSLFGQNGLPVSSFRSDNWDEVL